VGAGCAEPLSALTRAPAVSGGPSVVSPPGRAVLHALDGTRAPLDGTAAGAESAAAAADTIPGTQQTVAPLLMASAELP
jgi:hypothetical protein